MSYDFRALATGMKNSRIMKDYLLVRASYDTFDKIECIQVYFNLYNILYMIPRDEKYWLEKYGPKYHNLAENELPYLEIVLITGEVVDICEILEVC